jgi:hypothetical protein
MYDAITEATLAPKVWTYGAMLEWTDKILDLSGSTGVRGKMSTKTQEVENLEKSKRVLEAMTTAELASNDKRVFTHEALKLIAKKAEADLDYVNQVLTQHDMLRGDRRWMQIRKQYGRPFPATWSDRQLEAEFDRPPSKSEKDYHKRQQELMMFQRNKEDKPFPKFTGAYYRHPSRGPARWLRVPPKWYPNWSARPKSIPKNLRGPS